MVLRNHRKDGTLFFNELAIAPVASPDGGLHALRRHAVGRHRARARPLRAGRCSARLNAVFDLSPDGFVVFDREGQMVYCNQAFVQMTGWDAGPPATWRLRPPLRRMRTGAGLPRRVAAAAGN